MTDMVIPPEAREATAEAMFVHRSMPSPTFRSPCGCGADFPTAVQRQRHAAVAVLDAALPHLRPLFETATKAETKAIMETATKLGLELGRANALAEIANEMSTASPGQWADIRVPYVDVQIDKDTYRQLMAAREIGNPGNDWIEGRVSAEEYFAEARRSARAEAEEEVAREIGTKEAGE